MRSLYILSSAQNKLPEATGCSADDHQKKMRDSRAPAQIKLSQIFCRSSLIDQSIHLLLDVQRFRLTIAKVPSHQLGLDSIDDLHRLRIQLMALMLRLFELRSRMSAQWVGSCSKISQIYANVRKPDIVYFVNHSLSECARMLQAVAWVRKRRHSEAVISHHGRKLEAWST